MQTRSQTYARESYALINKLLDGTSRETQKRYGTLCHGLPLMIRESGLATALGYLAAKGADPDKPEARLLNHYARLLGEGDGAALHQTAIHANLQGYRRLTLNTLAAAEWFKRYAEAVLRVDASGNDTDQSAPEGEDDSHD